MTTTMVLDCDPGIDDAVAIAYAVAHPAIELVAVGSVWGNVDIDQTTRNALHVLEQSGVHTVPVALGERSCAVHDVLAVGVAAKLAELGLAPTVDADVEDGDGPARGATIFDLRGLYRGYPPMADAHIRVVLETIGDFADDVVTTIVASPAATGRS